MALGGGTFLVQNKVLPGGYINFISASRASASLSERGYATMPLELDWGIDGEVFTVTAEQFQKESIKIFGYPYTHEKLKGLRDLFLNIKTGYFFKLNTDGNKAACEFATALYTGVRGNNLKIVIEANEASTELEPLYDVSTIIDNTMVVDMQTVKLAKDLKSNDFVKFKPDATLTLSAGTPLTGGTSGTIVDGNYQIFLDKIESYSFNTIGCLSTEDTIKGLFANFTKRMRNDVGVKFQCVLYKYSNFDFEGVISVENKVIDTNDKNESSLIYWVAGAQAGCLVNKSNTNKKYNGEFDISVDYTQRQLEEAINNGKFIFHKVNDEIRVLEDINTFISFTDEKNSDFSSNQTIRVLDQIGNDIAAIFNNKYNGEVPNDASGRISLWNDIVKHHKELQKLRAIEEFKADDIKVDKGENKKSVVVTDGVMPTNAMAQLYMTVIVK